ncbi:hypothetical protein GINT2_001572 [Glugoides intestinalis]
MTLAIIQRANTIFSENISIGSGLVVFLSESLATRALVSRIPKLKLWNSWKETSSDKGASVLFVVKDKEMLNEVKEGTLEWQNHHISTYFLFLNQSRLEYVNDGPCTFIFD